MYTFYLAGGLFNSAERLHNLKLEKALIELGHKVILPQRRAQAFFHEGRFKLREMVEDCLTQCSDLNHIFIGNIDGTDADSGTAVEFGIAKAKGLKTILYRTDFRTHIETEVGVNGMFQLADNIIYFPAIFTDLDEVTSFYKTLAEKIILRCSIA
jgi:nucleoside 2-deoxyribosyltransferase